MVASARWTLGKMSATIAPDAAATTHDTMGSSQAAVIDERSKVFWLVVLGSQVSQILNFTRGRRAAYSRKGIPIATSTETAASKIQIAQMK